MLPDETQAFQFATMLHAGLPPSSAILYFIESEDPAEIALIVGKWQRSRLVKKASASLMGGNWHEKSTDEMMKYALDAHYRQLSTLLVTTNYIEANQGEKGKLDSARSSLEAKVAGQAGRGDALSQFFEDLRSKKIALPGVGKGLTTRTPGGVL
jgi:hypothetical protein